jgi:hypothetical protein
MLCLYKGSWNRLNRQILIPNGIVSIVVVLNFFEEVMVIEEKALILRYISSLLFISVDFLFINFNLNYLMDKINKSMEIRKLKYPLYMIMALIFIISFFRGELLIKDYNFNYTEYGLSYILGYGTSIIYLVYVVFSIMNNKKKNIDMKFREKVFLLGTSILWILSLNIYMVAIIWNKINIKRIEFIIYLFMIISFNIISRLFTPYRVSYSIFSDLRNLMLDYVFIIDEKGNIIYKNNRVEKAGVFNNINNIHIRHISLIFNKEIIIRKAYNKEFIKYLGKKSIYFGYSEKPIIEAEKVAGHIITFTDITGFINMLDELKQKQEETMKTNIKLSQYKDIVYNLEKEKEINSLLDEIANNQQKSMLELKGHMDKLKKCCHDDFIEKISIIINTAKDDLQDVRNAVTAYMNYYDE